MAEIFSRMIIRDPYFDDYYYLQVRNLTLKVCNIIYHLVFDQKSHGGASSCETASSASTSSSVHTYPSSPVEGFKGEGAEGDQ